MTIRELQIKLSKIPANSPINIARRNAILAQIYRLMR